MERRLIGTKYISYTEAKAIIYKRLQEAPSKDLIDKTWEYLGDVSTGDAEKASKIREKIKNELNIDDIVAANIVNICPKSPGEVRSILASKEPTKELGYKDDVIEKVLEMMKELCPEA